MPGHYVAQSEQTVRMASGHRTTGHGRYWGKGKTLIIFETNGMEKTRGAPANSG